MLAAATSRLSLLSTGGSPRCRRPGRGPAADGAQVPGRRGRHLVDGEVETLVPLLHLPSHPAGSVRRPAFDAPARRALAGRVLDALLEHEALDTTVDADSSVSPSPMRLGRPAASSFQRSTTPTPAPVPLLEHGLRDFVQLRRRGVRLGRRPADDRVPLPGGQDAPNSLFSSSGQTTTASFWSGAAVAPSHPRPSSGVLRELVDVALEPRLRPAALVVLAGCSSRRSAIFSSFPARSR